MKTPLRLDTRTAALAVLAVSLASGLAACGDRSAVFESAIEVSGPVVVGRHLAYMDSTRERVTLVRPLLREVRHVAVGRRPSFMLPSPDQGRLLVVCKGWLATSAGEDDEAPSLHVIDPATGASEVHLLGSPYDEVAVSDDNRYAVAFFAANRAPEDSEVFRNPNAVAILDLETGELEEKSVRSFGDVPRGVVFSPSSMAPLNPDGTLGPERTLAVVFAEGYVTFLDVAHPERREVTVRLALPGMSASIVPERMVFAPAAGATYLRVSGSSDVYVFSLAARETEDPTSNDFVISINTLAAGSVPADVALFRDGDRPKVLVANRSSMDLAVIDAQTAEFVTVPVGDPVDRILAYPPEDPVVAVLFCQAERRDAIHFLDLRGVESARGRNLTTLHGTEPVVGMELVPGRPLALVTHADDRSVLSVLDLSERTLSPFTGHAALSDYALTGDGRILAGFSAGRDQLGVVDLDHLSSRSVALEHGPSRVLTLSVPGGAATDPDVGAVLLHHDEPFGLLTVVPEPLAGGRAGAFELRGFLFEGLLDERYEE